jgi:predicted phosphodiesterase
MKLLLVSDLHANPAAIEVLPDADFVICGGDLMDYGPDPNAAIRFCHERNAIVVAGNHDVALAFGVRDGVTSAVAGAAAMTRQRHRRLLNEEDVHWLRALPHVARFTAGTLLGGLCHALPADVRSYAALTAAGAALHAALPGAALLLTGHTHVQGHLWDEGALVVNPGSVGMSEHGGFVEFAMWTDGILEQRREPYDVERTLAELRREYAGDERLDPLLLAFSDGRATVPRPGR